MKQYTIFVGNFGSGKSELAINFALKAARSGRATTLVDLDMINPYFRSAEREDVLAAAGVRLIAPPFALKKIEIMSLSPEVHSVFTPGEGIVVFDAGGDPAGATVLGQYRARLDALPPGSVETLMVINPFRPLADTAEKARALLEGLQLAARRPVTGLINNANLVSETTGAELLMGCQAVEALSRATGIPVYATSGAPAALADFKRLAEEQGLDPAYIGALWPLDITMHRTWDRYTREGL